MYDGLLLVWLATFLLFNYVCVQYKKAANQIIIKFCNYGNVSSLYISKENCVPKPDGWRIMSSI